MICVFVSPAQAGPANAKKYPILTHADYEIATGCDIAIGLYEPAVRTALTFLVFNDEPVRRDENMRLDFERTADDLHYVRRHSRDLFGPLFASQELGEPCLHPTLERIARAVDYPEDGYDWELLQSIREPACEDVVPYTMTSRPDYIEATGCLVSQSTYNHFRIAFLEHTLSYMNAYDAADRLGTFLRETGEGKHTADGFLDPACMTPTMTRIATELELLDDGRFVVQ